MLSMYLISYQHLRYRQETTIRSSSPTSSDSVGCPNFRINLPEHRTPAWELNHPVSLRSRSTCAGGVNTDNFFHVRPRCYVVAIQCFPSLLRRGCSGRIPTRINISAISRANLVRSSSPPPFDSRNSFTERASRPRGALFASAVGTTAAVAMTAMLSLPCVIPSLFFFLSLPLLSPFGLGTASSGAITSVRNRLYASDKTGTTHSDALPASAHASASASCSAVAPSGGAPHRRSSAARRSCIFSAIRLCEATQPERACSSPSPCPPLATATPLLLPGAGAAAWPSASPEDMMSPKRSQPLSPSTARLTYRRFK